MLPEEIDDAIAIVGLACRFPGAGSVASFWKNLHDGVDSTRVFSDEEAMAAGTDREFLRGPEYVKVCARPSNIGKFDAEFFGYSPGEASLIDPQHCLFLECAWSALEDSAHTPEVGRSIGVFAGAGTNRQFLRNLLAEPWAGGGQVSPPDFEINTGIAHDYLTSRVAYKLGLTGPSVTVQSACSTSLVAVAMACQSLRDYRCELALAGGVSIPSLTPARFRYQEGGILSPDGQCRSFDARARGSVFGSGAGVVVLERLEDALARGDRIDAIIRGWAVSNDGGSGAGFAAPSVKGQARVASEALRAADVPPRSISYLEAHGSGTPVGDPIEIEGLTEAFRDATGDAGFCAIGSVKTNVGHLDAAAGIAGLIKTMLALRHRMIPASLHFEAPNPLIDFAHSPFYVNTCLRDWTSEHYPRRAGVNSIGLGGTNAHLILEEAPPRTPARPSRGLHILTVSAKKGEALASARLNLAEHLESNPDLDLADVAYTLGIGRRLFHMRSAIICRDHHDAIEQLRGCNTPSAEIDYQRANSPAEPVFLFSGLGEHHIDMAGDLYRGEPLFRRYFDECASLFRPYFGGDLSSIVYPQAGHAIQNERSARSDLNQ